MIIIAHRNGAKETKENCIEGIQYCVNHGIKNIEVDVRTTKDMQLILYHDSFIMTKNKKKPISQLTYKEIKSINPKIPLLSKAIEVGKNLTWFIELKGSSSWTPKAIKKLHDTISNLPKSPVIISFHLNILKKNYSLLKNKVSYGLIGYGSRDHSKKWEATLKLHWIEYLLIHWKALFHNNFLSLLKNNFKIIAWTVNDINKAKLLSKKNIHSIITDFPLYMMENLKSTPHN